MELNGFRGVIACGEGGVGGVRWFFWVYMVVGGVPTAVESGTALLPFDLFRYRAERHADPA